MKILSPRAHGYLDFLVVVAFALAPSLCGFSNPAATLSYVIAAIHLVVSLVTAYPLGILKLIPFPVHGALEFIVAIGLVALPWIAGFAADVAARNFYLGAGVVVILVVLMTDYKSAVRAHTLTVSRMTH